MSDRPHPILGTYPPFQRSLSNYLSFLIALFFLGLYVMWTLRPGVLPADSGEFQWVAATLGVAHPPGFPLYTLLAHLFTYLPGESAINVNLFSAVTSIGTLILFFHTLFRLTAPRADRGTPLFAATTATLVTTLLLGTGTTFWAQATTANIRSLTTLFAAFLFWLFVRHLPGRVKETPPLLFIALGLGLGVTHHLSLLFIGLVLVLYLVWAYPPLLTDPTRLGRFIGWGGLGLLPLLYLPWREPSLRALSPFFVYVTGLGFSNDFFFVGDWAELRQRMTVMINVLTFQWPTIVLLLGLFGLILLLTERGKRPLGILFLTTFVVHTLVAATYRAPQTVEYMLPAYLPLMLSTGYGLYRLILWLSSRPEWPASRYALLRNRPLRWIGALVLVGLLLFPAGGQAVDNGRSYRWLATQYDTLELTRGWLEEAPSDTLILADWHWFTPLNYLQAEFDLRPDIHIEFVNPRSDNYGRDWAESINSGLMAGRPVIATHYDPDQYHDLPPYIPLAEAFLFPQAPLDPPAQRFGFDFEDGFFENGVEVLGATSSFAFEYALSDTIAFNLAWRLRPELDRSDGQPWKIYAHLLDSEGELIAQADLDPQIQPAGISVTRFELTPRPGAALGPSGLSIRIGIYTLDGTPQPLPDGTPHLSLFGLAATGSHWRPITANREPFWRPKNSRGWRQIGRDIDHSVFGETRIYTHFRLPDGTYHTVVETVPRDPNEPPTSFYVPLGNGLVWTGATPAISGDGSPLGPGERLTLTQRFQSDRPQLRDIGIAVRLIGLEEDNFTWAWLNPDPDNDVPATGAIPTLKWVAGSRVDHPRFLTISPDAEPGQTVEGFLRPYHIFTRRALPILDERVTNSGRPWIIFDRGQIGDE